MSKKLKTLVSHGLYIYSYWRASGASETLSGVTQLKIEDVCLLSSERSEQGSMYIYMSGLYVCPLNARACTVFSPKNTAF